VICVRTGRAGVVRFTGTTLFAPGEWVGLELAEGGRHDGEVDGHRYFACPPDKGLFVRPSAVQLENANVLNAAAPAAVPPTKCRGSAAPRCVDTTALMSAMTSILSCACYEKQTYTQVQQAKMTSCVVRLLLATAGTSSPHLRDRRQQRCRTPEPRSLPPLSRVQRELTARAQVLNRICP
jgi:hypothetical protein